MPTPAPCPKCRSPLPEGHARFCPACYTRVEGFPLVPTPGSRRPAPRPTPGFTRVAVAAALVLALGVAAAFKGVRGAARGSVGHAPTLLATAIALTAWAGLGAFGHAPTLLTAAAGLAAWAAVARLTETGWTVRRTCP